MAGEGDTESRERANGSEPPRPSLPPAAPANYRLGVAALWLGLQIALVSTAGRRLDGAFGFRMFSESSTVKITLFRELVEGGRPVRVHVEGGAWNARGQNGLLRPLSWYDRVPMPRWAFDQETHASYGAAAQVARLQAALDDVSTHVPDDAETVRFILVVTTRRNGHEPTTAELTGPERHVAISTSGTSAPPTKPTESGGR